MEKELTKLIKNKIDELSDEIKEKSKMTKRYAKVYSFLKPKGKEFKLSNVLNFEKDLSLTGELSCMIEESDLIAIESLQEKMDEYDECSRKFEEKLKELGLSTKVIYSDEFIEALYKKSLTDFKFKKIYKELMEMKERDAVLAKQNEEIVTYICNSGIRIYEDALNTKERLKYRKRGLEYALESIRKSEPFSSWSVTSLESLTSSLNYYEQRKFIRLLLKYNERIAPKNVC